MLVLWDSNLSFMEIQYSFAFLWSIRWVIARCVQFVPWLRFVEDYVNKNSLAYYYCYLIVFEIEKEKPLFSLTSPSYLYFIEEAPLKKQKR